jgi:hypothetical protein
MAHPSKGLRIGASLVGLALASPLDLFLVRNLDAGATLGVLVTCSLAGVLALRWATGSWSLAALLASIVNVPLAVYFGVPEAGEWASFFGVPKYFLFCLVGWLGVRGPSRPSLRWAGAVVPTMLLVVPFFVQLAVAFVRRSP